MAQNPAKSPLAPGRTPGQRAADVLINFEPADRFNQLIAQMQLGNAWESMKPFRHPDSELGGLIRKANREPPEMAKPIARTMVAKLLSDTGEDVKSQATSLALRKRLAVSDGIAPFAGDVVLYQARGEAICDFIQAQIAQAPMPVVLVAHRLGGVACVDLLVKHDPFRQGPRFGDRGFPSATPV